MTLTVQNADVNVLEMLLSLAKIKKDLLITTSYTADFEEMLLNDSKELDKQIADGTATIYPNAKEALKALNA